MLSVLALKKEDSRIFLVDGPASENKFSSTKETGISEIEDVPMNEVASVSLFAK